MKILSFTHTICSTAGVAHFKSAGPAADATLADAQVYHPVGTVLDLVDVEALDLVKRGYAVAWDPKEHGASPGEIAGRLRGPHGSAVQQSGEARYG